MSVSTSNNDVIKFAKFCEISNIDLLCTVRKRILAQLKITCKTNFLDELFLSYNEKQCMKSNVIQISVCYYFPIDFKIQTYTQQINSSL